MHDYDIMSMTTETVNFKSGNKVRNVLINFTELIITKCLNPSVCLDCVKTECLDCVLAVSVLQNLPPPFSGHGNTPTAIHPQLLISFITSSKFLGNLSCFFWHSTLRHTLRVSNPS